MVDRKCTGEKRRTLCMKVPAGRVKAIIEGDREASWKRGQLRNRDSNNFTIADSERSAVPPEGLFTDLRLVSILRQSWKIWTANLIPILFVTAVVWLTLNLIGNSISHFFLSESTEPSMAAPSSFRKFIPQFLIIGKTAIGLFALGAVYCVSENSWNGGTKATLGQMFSYGYKNWGRLIFTRLAFLLLLLDAFFVLLFPGLFLFNFQQSQLALVTSILLTSFVTIFLWARHLFSDVAAVVAQCGGFSALRRSREVTKGHFWRVVGFQGLIFLTFLFIAILLVIPFNLPFFETFLP